MKKIIFYLLLLPLTLLALRDPFSFAEKCCTPSNPTPPPAQEHTSLEGWDITHQEKNYLIIKNEQGETRKIELVSFLK